VYVAQGKYTDAEPLYQRSLAIVEKAFGPEDRTVILGLKRYAVLLRKMDRGREAAEIEAHADALSAKHAP
jgi:hypothetical protein